jgi:hypothetical protein
VDKLALGKVFFEYFSSSCQSLFQKMLHAHLSSGAGTIGQLVVKKNNGAAITVFRVNTSIPICSAIFVQKRPG